MEALTYTAKEVAQLLQVSEQSVYELRNTGKLPAIGGIGRVLFNREQVHAFIGLKEEYTPYEFRRLQAENKRLSEEVEALKSSIRSTTRAMLQLADRTI